MYMSQAIVLIVVLTIYGISAQYVGLPGNQFGPPRWDSRCGPEFGMAGCNPGDCCSPSGYCGNTPMHCGGANPNMGMGYGGNGPSGFVRDDGRCGPDIGAVCAPGMCCSPEGYCGDGPQYCGGGGYGYGQGYPMMGGQGGPMMSPPNGQWNAPRDDGQCGPNYDWAGCYDGSCCGPDQYCGPQFCY